MGLEGLAEHGTEPTFEEWLKAHTHYEDEMVQIRAIARAANAAQGIPDGPPDVTMEELHARMVRSGWKLEERLFQKELMRMRYGDCNEDE